MICLAHGLGVGGYEILDLMSLDLSLHFLFGCLFCIT